MASLHKTYANGVALTATELNNGLNPDTADHIPYAVAAGGVTVTFPASDTTLQAVSVSFPASRFAVAPNVQVTLDNGASDSVNCKVWASSATTSGFTLCFSAYPALGTALSGMHVAWVAVQMTPSSASG